VLFHRGRQRLELPRRHVPSDCGDVPEADRRENDLSVVSYFEKDFHWGCEENSGTGPDHIIFPPLATTLTCVFPVAVSIR